MSKNKEPSGPEQSGNGTSEGGSDAECIEFRIVR